METRLTSPDRHARGLLGALPESLRYEAVSRDPDDVAGKLAQFIPAGAKVLDVGCGTGSVSQLVAELSGANLVGIEPDGERVAVARARGLNAYQGYLSGDFVRAHGPFDYVLFADVLEHLPSPATLVELAMEGLVSGGALLASVPNVAQWFVRQELLWGNFDYEESGIMDATHLRWFTRRTICEFFERLDLRVTAVDFTVGAWHPGYQRHAPWRWIRWRHRASVVRRLVRLWPTLFGCQIIVRAVKP